MASQAPRDTMIGPDRDRLIRVDHAGEFGAVRIYAGQQAVMGKRAALSGEIAHMAIQEQQHLRTFEKLVAENRVRPTVLMPLWNVAGYALGVASALIGEKAAMAVTAAVETEIDRHYGAQLKALDNRDKKLSDTIERFQAEEVEHREAAFRHGARSQPAWPLMSALVRAGCRVAIRISERI